MGAPWALPDTALKWPKCFRGVMHLCHFQVPWRSTHTTEKLPKPAQLRQASGPGVGMACKLNPALGFPGLGHSLLTSYLFKESTCVRDFFILSSFDRKPSCLLQADMVKSLRRYWRSHGTLWRQEPKHKLCRGLLVNLKSMTPYVEKITEK